MYLVLTCLILVPVSAYDDTDLKFIDEFTSHHNFHSNFYNIIVCEKPGSINLMKMLSESCKRFVAVHREEEALGQISDEPQTFVLNLHCAHGREILEEANKLKLFSKPYQWIVFAHGINYALNQIGGNFSDFEYNWYWSFLETLDILIDSDFKIVERDADERISVTAVYKITKNWDLLREPMAQWTPDQGLTVLNSKGLASRRLNLRGAVLQASFVAVDPRTMDHLDDLVDKHIDTTSKVSFNIVNLFPFLLNVSMTYLTKKTWGIFENGSYTGMLGDIAHGDAELGASPLFLQASRMDVIEYYGMVNPTGTKFIFLSPPLSYSNNIFIMPFDTLSWLSFFGMIAVSCFLLHTALKLEYSEWKESDGKRNKSSISFAELLILNIGAICLQGTVAQTRGPAGRIITLFLYMMYLFLYISYSASIVAILQSSDTSIQTVKDILESPLKAGADDVSYSQYYFKNAIGLLRTISGIFIEKRKFIYVVFVDLQKAFDRVHWVNMMEILKNTGVDCMDRRLIGNLYVGQFFKVKNADDEVRKTLYHLKIAPKGEAPHFLPVEEGIKQIRRGLYAYHVEPSSGYQIIQRTFTEEEKCGLQETRDSFLKLQDPWLVFRKKTPYAEVLKIGVKRIIETGFKSRFGRRYYTKKPVCSAKGSRFVSVGILDCYYAFMLLVGGASLSIFIMILEVIFNKYVKNYKINKKLETENFTSDVAFTE